MVFVIVPGGPDAVASDPSDCDVELRVVRRVARVIDELQPRVASKSHQPGIAGMRWSFAYARDDASLPVYGCQ
jgi:hypothetical protein